MSGAHGNPWCHCGQESFARTVQKEGPNQGRDFYCCGTRSCKFFEWADGATHSPPNSKYTKPGHTPEDPWKKLQDTRMDLLIARVAMCEEKIDQLMSVTSVKSLEKAVSHKRPRVTDDDEMDS